MQLHLTLAKSSLAVPINYRPLVHGAIYRALGADQQFSTILHDNNAQNGTARAYKGFTFSPLSGVYTRADTVLWFQNQASLEIRAWDEALIRLLHQSLLARGALTLGAEELALTRCEITDTHVDAARAPIRMLSPVVAYITEESGRTVFFQPDEERFYASLIHNAERKCLRFLPGVPFDLRIRSLNPGLPRKQFSRFKKTYINAWFGQYLLEGAPQIIDLMYQIGLGAKNSQGFGMFALERENPGGSV